MKKVISIVLAFVMVFSLCAVGASATVDDALMAIRIKPAAASYSKGDTVTFDVCYETSSWLGGLATCNLTIAYDSDVFETVDDISNGKQPKLSETTGILWGTGYKITSENMEPTLSWMETYRGSLATADTAKGWDSAFNIKMVHIQAGGYYDASTEVKSFGFQLKIKEDAPADGCYTVGVPVAAVKDGTTFVDEEIASVYDTGDVDDYMGETTGLSKFFDIADGTITIASATPSVTHEKTMGQMKSWSTLTGPFNGGLVGKISDLALTFDGENQCNEIKKIEVAVTTDAGTTTSEAYQVYEQADGSYLFRAVIKNMDTTDTKTFSCKYIVTLADGTTTYSSADVTGLSANGIYTAALANYNASK